LWYHIIRRRKWLPREIARIITCLEESENLSAKFGYITSVIKRLHDSQSFPYSGKMIGSATRVGVHKEAPVFVTVPKVDIANRLILQSFITHIVGSQLGIQTPEPFVCACNRELLDTAELDMSSYLASRDPDSAVKTIAQLDNSPHRVSQPIQIQDLLNKKSAFGFLCRLAIYDEILFIKNRASVEYYSHKDCRIREFEGILCGPGCSLESLEKKILDPSENNSVVALIVNAQQPILSRMLVRDIHNYSLSFGIDPTSCIRDLCLYSSVNQEIVAGIIKLLNKRAGKLTKIFQYHFDQGSMFCE